MLTALRSLRQRASEVFRLLLNWIATGLFGSDRSLQLRCSLSLQTHPESLTSRVGAPVNATPISVGKDQCRCERGMKWPNPPVRVNAALFLLKPRVAVPDT